jgi:4'-phosphopantetheinyl transferase
MGGTIDVETLRLDAEPQVVRALTSWLSDDELERAGRLKFERDRRRFIVARGWLREQLSARLGQRPDEVKLASGGRGKPFVVDDPELRFNVSHCEDLAVLAFGRGREIGVDVEAVRPLPELDALAVRIFSPREYQAYAALEASQRASAFYRTWTRKEAYVKALGEGFYLALDRIDVSQLQSGWQIESFNPAAGFVAAVVWQQEMTCARS